MRTKIIGLLALSLLLLLTFSIASAHGHSPDQLTKNGAWTCIPIPFGEGEFEEFWPHCFQSHKFPPSPGPSGNLPSSIVVKVFDDEKDGFHYLGSEILLRADLYRGQPCMQDGGEPYHDLSGEGLPYVACHHFDTSAYLDG